MAGNTTGPVGATPDPNAVQITGQVAQASGLGAALDAGLALATKLLGNVPAAPGLTQFNPALLSADQIRSIFENAPKVDYGTAATNLAAQRQAALRQQLASLDSAHQEAVKGLDGAYTAVVQQLGVAQQNVGAGFADMVRQQGMVNAQAAQGAQGAQAQAAQMAGSLGLSSVGGQQAAGATDAGIQAMIASNAIDQGLLSSNAGAMSQYIGSVAPALAGYGRFGALSNLKRASMEARANAEAQSAAAGLEDYRRFQELGLQADQSRADALTSALLGAQSTNVTAINQARQTNVAAENARRTSIWQAGIDRQNTIASTGVSMAGKIMEEAQQKEASLAAALKSAEATRRWNLDYDLRYKKYLDDAGFSSGDKMKVQTQALKVKSVLQPYAAAGGYQSLINKTDPVTGKQVPLGPNEVLVDRAGNFLPQNFLAWTQATGGNYGNVMAYLATAQLTGSIKDGDAREFLKIIAQKDVEQQYLASSGLQADDARFLEILKKNQKEIIKMTQQRQSELATEYNELVLPVAGGNAGFEALKKAYTELGVPILGTSAPGVLGETQVPSTPGQFQQAEARRRSLIAGQASSYFAETMKVLDQGGSQSINQFLDDDTSLKRLVSLLKEEPWAIEQYIPQFVAIGNRQVMNVAPNARVEYRKMLEGLKKASDEWNKSSGAKG